MVNTEVKIGKLTLRNPVVTGSGTFGFGPEMVGIVDLNKIGACVVKSTSREPRLGNPTPRIVETPSGILNAIGLQNGGVDNFIQRRNCRFCVRLTCRLLSTWSAMKSAIMSIWPRN